MLTGDIPTAAPSALIVRVALPPLLLIVLLGLKLAVTCAGNVPVVRLTASVLPLVFVVEIA